MLKSEKRKNLKGEKLDNLKPPNPDEKPSETSADGLREQIEKACEGLFYTSETDAKISSFLGQQTEVVNKETLIAQTGNSPDSPVKEGDFAKFFAPLTEIQDWFGDEETEIVKKFTQLKEVLERNLRDLKVFKVGGKVELDIYVVGLEAENVLMGIKTESVESSA